MSANPNGAKFDLKVRRELIIIAATGLARKPNGWQSLTRTAIAEASQCSPALVSRSVGDMDAVRAVVMKQAIRYQYLDLIAQGIAANYPACRNLSPILKHRAIALLVG
jgi:AcrR family transcriptional regulator